MTQEQLTALELTELRKICFNDAALGAFSGMIFNDMSELADPKMWTDADISTRVRAAIRIRLMVREMSK
jgi:hypothetical protein